MENQGLKQVQRAKLHAHRGGWWDLRSRGCRHWAGGQGLGGASCACAGHQAYTCWAAASFTGPIESMDGEVEGGSVRRRAARLACSSSQSLRGKEAECKGQPGRKVCGPLEAG